MSQEPNKSADIEHLMGKGWNAHAALADSLNTVSINAPIIICWLDENGDFKHRSSCKNLEALWLVETFRSQVLEFK